MIDILYDPAVMALLAGVGWGALMYESIEKMARYYIYNNMDLDESTLLDMVDDGKLNQSTEDD